MPVQQNGSCLPQYFILTLPARALHPGLVCESGTTGSPPP